MNTIWAALKHYVIHLALAVAIYILLLLMGRQTSLGLWIIATFSIDVDHLVSFANPNDPTTKKLFEVLKSDKFLSERITAAVKILEDQGFSRLIFHNIPAFVFVLVVVFANSQNIILLSLFGAFLVHQIFDMYWDFRRWGNINHWLWR